MTDVDKDLAKALQVARKKPRNFAIIAKGANVLKLLVDKKPIKDGAVTAAKKACHGNAAIKGVVLGGDGPELVFQVTEAPGVGDVKLRKFITDETQLILKARFEVVAVLQEVNDQDDEAAAAAAGEPAAGTVDAAPTKSTASPAAPNPEAIRFAQRLKPLKPNLDKVLAASVSVSHAAQQTFAAASHAFKQQDLPAAHRALDQLEPLIKQGMEQLAAKAFAGGDPGALFNERLRTLLPDIKTAAGTPAGDEAKLKASEAGVFARKKDFSQANQLLDLVETLLKKESPAEADAFEELYSGLLTTLPGDLKLLQAANAGAAAPIQKIVDAAKVHAQSGDFKEAYTALDQAAQLLAKAQRVGRAPGPADGPNAPAIKAALAGWEAARRDAIAQLQKLDDAVSGFDHPQAAEAIILLKAIQANLTAKPETLQSVIELERYLETDEIITEAEEPNGFGITVVLREPLLEALGELKPLLSA